MKTGINQAYEGGLLGTINPTNLLANGDFESWSAGASAAPDGWTLTGAGASVAKNSGGSKTKDYSATLTRSGATAYLEQSVHAGKGINYWKGRTVTLGVWVYATVASRARLQIADGVVSSFSSYHTGNSTWQFLTVTMTIDASADQITIYLVVDTGDTAAHFDGAMCVEGSQAFAFSPKVPEEGVLASFKNISTITGFTGALNADGLFAYKIGKLVTLYFGLDGTSNDTVLQFTVPWVAASGINYYNSIGQAMNNSATLLTPTLAGISGGTSLVTFFTAGGGGVWTASGRKFVYGSLSYIAA